MRYTGLFYATITLNFIIDILQIPMLKLRKRKYFTTSTNIPVSKSKSIEATRVLSTHKNV